MAVLHRIALILCLAFVVFIAAWWGIPAYEKGRADSLVEELCKKDGGLKVYETVELPASRFKQYGVVFPGRGMLPALREEAKPGDEFFFVLDKKDVWPETGWHPYVWRIDQKLFRQADGKLLGEAISYSRRGGDPIGPWHPSSNTCPRETDITVLVGRVFVKAR